MPEVTVEQQNKLERARRLSKKRERAQVFREVFGVPPQYTKHGKMILDALHEAFEIGRGIPKNMLDDHGQTDLWQTSRRLGHFDVIQSIHDLITWKESEHVDTRSTGTG